MQTTVTSAPAAALDAQTRVPISTHWTLLVLLFVYTMSFLDRQIMGILIQPIKAEFGVSDTAMGVLSGVTFALFYSTLAIPFARYADRANRRNFIAYCCAVWSFMTAMCGIAGSFWTLALARVGVAVGEAGGTAPSITMIADHYPPEQRGRAMSVYMLGPQLGILFGLGLGGWIAHHYGWRQAFLWMGIPGIIAALLLRFTTVEPMRGRWEAAKTAPAVGSMRDLARDLWRSNAFTRITWTGLALGFAGYGIGIWTPAFLVRSHGMTLQSAGAVMGILGGLAAVTGALSSGWLSDALAKRDPRWRLGVPVLGCVLALPCGVMFYLAPAGGQWMVAGMGVPHAIVWYLLFGVTTVWWMAPAYAAMSDIVAPNRRATALAFFNLGLTMIGGGLGPLLVGLLSDSLTAAHGNEALRWALVYSMAAYLVGIVSILAAIGPYIKERSAMLAKQPI